MVSKGATLLPFKGNKEEYVSAETERRNRETWQNVTAGKVVIWKFDVRGNLIAEMVMGGAKFNLTNEERQLNMDRAANPELDNFKNGTLSPVRLMDGTEDAKELAANPNLMTEDDMKALFKGHWRTFETRVQEINNLSTLNRLKDLSREVNATVKQMDVIEARVVELSPQVTEVTSTPIGTGPPRGRSQGVTP